MHGRVALVMSERSAQQILERFGEALCNVHLGMYYTCMHLEPASAAWKPHPNPSVKAFVGLLNGDGHQLQGLACRPASIEDKLLEVPVALQSTTTPQE